MTTQEEVLRLLLAAVLGLGIGLEREVSNGASCLSTSDQRNSQC
jgi:uncharacterized membrane protein YhiD involved in acid resistance